MSCCQKKNLVSMETVAILDFSGIEIAFSVYHRHIFRTPTPYIWRFLDISLVTMLTQLVA